MKFNDAFHERFQKKSKFLNLTCFPDYLTSHIAYVMSKMYKYGII